MLQMLFLFLTILTSSQIIAGDLGLHESASQNPEHESMSNYPFDVSRADLWRAFCKQPDFFRDDVICVLEKQIESSEKDIHDIELKSNEAAENFKSSREIYASAQESYFRLFGEMQQGLPHDSHVFLTVLAQREKNDKEQTEKILVGLKEKRLACISRVSNLRTNLARLRQASVMNKVAMQNLPSFPNTALPSVSNYTFYNKYTGQECSVTLYGGGKEDFFDE